MKLSEAIKEMENGKKAVHPEIDLKLIMQDGILKEQHCAVTVFQYNAAIVTTEGWELVGEDGTYKFSDIIHLILSGKKARLHSWVKEDFILYDSQMKDLYLHKLETHGVSHIPFSILGSDKWKVID